MTMTHPPRAPKPPMSTAKKAAIGAAVLVCAPFVIGGMVSGAKQELSSRPAAAKSSPANISASQKPAFKLTLPPQHLAPPNKRKNAAAILRANDAYYRDEFNRGVTVILARGNANSFPAFHIW
jgi:hypothetical protein